MPWWIAAATAGAAAGAWVGVVGAARLARRHVADGGEFGPLGGAARGTMVLARRLIRCVVPRVVDRGACDRAAQQPRAIDVVVDDAGAADGADPEGAPRPTCFLGDEEFAGWERLTEDLTRPHLLPEVADPINSGVDGATAQDLRRNLHDLVLRHAPRALVLHLGTNDYDAAWFASPETVAHATALAVAGIIDDCYSYGTRDVRLLLAPRPPGRTDRQQRYMDVLVVRLGELVRTYDPTVWYGLRLEFVDGRAGLANELLSLGDAAYLGDQLTPSPEAHRLKAEVLRAALAL